MRIVNRAEFLAMPPGTVYAVGIPHCYGPWEIKTGSCDPDDWFFDSLSTDQVDSDGSNDLMDKWEAMLHEGKSFPMDFEQTGRNGQFEPDAIFAILEPDDIRQLIARLQRCLP